MSPIGVSNLQGIRVSLPLIRIPILPPGIVGQAAAGRNASRSGHLKRKEIGRWSGARPSKPALPAHRWQK